MPSSVFESLSRQWIEDLQRTPPPGRMAGASVLFDGSEWAVNLTPSEGWAGSLLSAVVFLESGHALSYGGTWKDLAFALMHRVNFPENASSASLPDHREVYERAVQEAALNSETQEQYLSVAPGGVQEGRKSFSAVRIETKNAETGALEDTKITRVRPFELYAGEEAYMLVSMPLSDSMELEAGLGRLADSFGQSVPRIHSVKSTDSDTFLREAVYRLSEFVSETLSPEARKSYDEMWKTGLWTWLSWSERDESMESLSTFLEMELKEVISE